MLPSTQPEEVSSEQEGRLEETVSGKGAWGRPSGSDCEPAGRAPGESCETGF